MTAPINTNRFQPGATALQGRSKHRYFHIANPSALQDITSTFYRIIPRENREENNSYIFIECSNANRQESYIYREHFVPNNDPNQPLIRYAGLEGSLVELSLLDRERILERIEDNSLSKPSAKSI